MTSRSRLRTALARGLVVPEAPGRYALPGTDDAVWAAHQLSGVADSALRRSGSSRSAGPTGRRGAGWTVVRFSSEHVPLPSGYVRDVLAGLAARPTERAVAVPDPRLSA